jgi:uncharacterized membrane protein YvlD (DUF360 family)
MTGERTEWRARLRWRLGDLGRGVVGLVAAMLGIWLASALLPGFEVDRWSEALAAAIAITVLSAVLRPIMVWLASRLGWPGAVVLAMFGQAFVVWLVFFDPGDASESVTFMWAFAAAWLIAFVTTAAAWVVTAGTDEAVTAGLVRRARRRGTSPVPDPEVPGIVFVQADGVPFPVLEMGVKGGTLPTLSRWVRSGSHRMAEWRPRLPATTPASQMGILHGTIDGIPAFRWVDRPTGRVFVANKPADAKDIEALHSDGHGLLADDGVSVSNLFTGDAVTAYVTMSALDRTQQTQEARVAVSRFLARPDGLARGVSRTLSEVVRERFQRRRAITRDLRPRVHRGWGFAGERAALNGVLRDLNTSLVADSMLQGRRVIYVDYVDYDAVAHHAGILRQESLDALSGIDAVLAQLEKVAEVAPRHYLFVVLSDHGQSQGEVFADRYGEDLATLVGRLAHADVAGALEANAEGAGRVHGLTTWASGGDSSLDRAFVRMSEGLSARAFDDAGRAQAAETSAGPDEAEPSSEQFIVFGSGNLGLVYVAGEHERLTREQIDYRYPALVSGLVEHPGVGFVVVDSADGLMVLGARGEHRLADGSVTGDDPLAAFGPDAPAFVQRAASMPESPDIMINSLLDDMGEVAAFEGLVGCHGGLGGWQDRAMIVWPSTLPEPDGMVVGADAVHDLLVSWLDGLGHRQELPPRRQRPYDAAQSVVPPAGGSHPDPESDPESDPASVSESAPGGR